MTVEFGERLWKMKIGYDERWAKCLLRILLMHETLRCACDNGLKGDVGHLEPWQRRWPLQTNVYTTIGYYPFSLGYGVTVGRLSISTPH
jgi:hypothetical protein